MTAPAAARLERVLRTELPGIQKASAEIRRLLDASISHPAGRRGPDAPRIEGKINEAGRLFARFERQLAGLATLVRRRSVAARLLAAQIRRARRAEQAEELSACSWSALVEEIRRVLLSLNTATGDTHRRPLSARFSRLHRRRAP